MNKRHPLGAAALAAALVFAPFTNAVAASFAPAPPAVRQDDTPPEAETDMFSKGQNLFLQGRYDQAASVFNDFLKQYPKSIITDLTLLWLGRSYMQLGRIKEAEDVGGRLRALPDTPFTEVYESELQTARQEARSRPAPAAPTPTRREVAAAPTTTPPTTRPTPTPAAPRPTPTPRQVARATPTGEAARSASSRDTPTLVIRRDESEGSRGRRRRTNPPTSVAARATTATTATSPPVVRPTPAPTPTPTPTRRRQEVAANTRTTAATTRPPVTTPTEPPARPAETRDPALAAPTSAPSIAETSPPPQGGGFSVTVRQVPDLRLALRRTALAAQPGQLVQLPLAVTNAGNKDDQFRLETDLPAEFQPTFSLVQNGTDTGMPVLITSQLAREANLEVMLNIRVPDNAPDNLQRNFIVRAASQSDAQVTKAVDASLTVVAAALTADASVSAETVMPGETFSQRISVRNQGSAAARNARADFVFNPDFELVSANPSPLQYDRASSTAIWSLGELDSRDTREITVTLRAAPDALAATRPLGRGTLRTASLVIPSNFDGPPVSVGRVTRARIEAVSAGLTATPGDTLYVPFIVRNPSNYPENYALQITAPGAPSATIYADTNGDGRHQEDEPQVTQTAQIEPRGGQFPVLLRVDIPRSTPDRQQYAYNVVTRASSQRGVAGEASTVLTVAAPRVRVRTEAGVTDVRPGDTFFYRLVLVNDGAGLAKGLTVTEYLPNALQFVSSDPSLSAQDATGGAQAIAWRVNELAPGDTAVLKLTVRLKPNLPANEVITPRHSLGYQDTNGNSYQGQ